jgi:hypothetical protein
MKTLLLLAIALALPMAQAGAPADVKMITPSLAKLKRAGAPIYMATLSSMQWRRNTASLRVTTDSPAYIIEKTTDFKSWVPVSTNAHASQINIEVDCLAGKAAGFYRVRNAP